MGIRELQPGRGTTSSSLRVGAAALLGILVLAGCGGSTASDETNVGSLVQHRRAGPTRA